LSSIFLIDTLRSDVGRGIGMRMPGRAKRVEFGPPRHAPA